MKNRSSLITTLVISVLLLSSLFSSDVKLLKDEAQMALKYLNKIRANPKAYSREIGVNLSYVKPKHAFEWNEALAKAAENKARDMAKRDYMAHTDPDGYGMNYYINAAGYKLVPAFLKNKSDNFFESVHFHGGSLVQRGKNGTYAIKNLVLDKGVNPPGHRNHLLGIKDFWAKCEDAGIGIAQRGDKVYVCVLIAKHDF